MFKFVFVQSFISIINKKDYKWINMDNITHEVLGLKIQRISATLLYIYIPMTINFNAVGKEKLKLGLCTLITID